VSVTLRSLARLLVLVLPLAACGLPGNVVIDMPDENGVVGRVVVSNAAGSVELREALAAVGVSRGGAPRKPFIADQKEVFETFSDALAARPRAPAVFILYFVTGETVIMPESTGDLAAAIATALRTPYPDIGVVGHADATGTDAINLPLSLHRAETVRDKLVAAGVPAAAIEISYHGANNPRVPTPPGVPEPKNRRVEVTIR
jgi:outer membrane protein OmpA-like peptidoglycan-associated protein